MSNDDRDTQLLKACAGGDREAMRTLLQRHGPSVRQHVDREMGQVWRSVLDADDVMQVTYLEAFMQQDALKTTDGRAFAAWLRQIAMNNLRDAVKELGRQKRPHPAKRVEADGAANDSYISLIRCLSDAAGTPSRHVEAAEAAAAVHAVLRRLPPDYAEVIRLYDLENLPIADVSESMGRSQGAVHMLRLRAHDRLRSMIGQETDFFSQAP